MKLNRHHSLLKDGRLQASLDEHGQLMQALSGGQGEQARHAMALHFRNGLSAATAGH
jgi:DNA-binding GntR family transcriptional regulator